MSTPEFSALKEVYAIQQRNFQCLVEDKKDKIIDNIVNKVGLDEVFGIILADIFNKLAIIISNKFKNQIQSDVDALFYISDTDNIRELMNVRDWIRIGYGGNIDNEFRQMTWDEMIQSSNNWHNSLASGKGDIALDKYIEEEEIIDDYRDSNGLGYYWVNLKRNICDKEHKRTGHCAYANGVLLSLRISKQEGVNAEGRKIIINQSMVTAEYLENKRLSQIKGHVNSKPKKEYEPYIIKLLMIPNFVTGILPNSNKKDFSEMDISLEDTKAIMESNPSFQFSEEHLRRVGLINATENNNYR